MCFRVEPKSRVEHFARVRVLYAIAPLINGTCNKIFHFLPPLVRLILSSVLLSLFFSSLLPPRLWCVVLARAPN